MDTLSGFFQYKIMNIELWQLLGCFIIVLATLILRSVIKKIFYPRIRELTKRTDTRLDDFLIEKSERPVYFLVMIIGLYFAVMLLNPPVEPVNVRLFVKNTFLVLITIGAVWISLILVDIGIAFYRGKSKTEDPVIDQQLLPMFAKTLKIFILIVAALMIIQNLGYSVTSLLAGLGIGGLAVALAAKDALSNIFGSIAVLLDRPFKVGDWIKTSKFEGIVESVGFRSTRIRTFAKTLISVPNSEVANMEIENFTLRPQRRIFTYIGVTYASTVEQIEKAVEGIKEILKNHPHIDDEMIKLVFFDEFGSSSLDIMVYCFSDTSDWSQWLQIKQEVYLSMMRLLEDLGLQIAFPSQTVYLKHVDKFPEFLPPASNK
jgi:MscS family membrane protein